MQIDDVEDEEKLTIDELSALHNELLQQASSALEESDHAVNWLRSEREAAAAVNVVGIRTAGGDPAALGEGGGLEPLKGPRKSCCPAPCSRLRTCVIL